jgi:hypothetical protein
LPQAGVDNFHSGIAQGAGNDFRAAVVAIEAGLGNQDADFAVRGHDSLFAVRLSRFACHPERGLQSESRDLRFSRQLSTRHCMINPKGKFRQ